MENKAPEVKSQVASFFIPASKRLRLQKDGQAEKSTAARVTRLHTRVVKEKSSSVALTVKEAVRSNSASTVQLVEHDLRLEAVLAAEENARLNAGKATHPFFAKQKVIPSLTTSVRPDESATYQVEAHEPCPPIHITQCTQDDRRELAWEGWKFTPAVVDEGSKKDDLMCSWGQKGFSFMQHLSPSSPTGDEQRPHCSASLTDLHSVEFAAVSEDLVNEETFSDGNQITAHLKGLQDLLEYMETWKSMKTRGMKTQLSDIDVQGLDKDMTLEKLKHRLCWYTARRDMVNPAETSKEAEGQIASFKQNSLWTDLYQPRSPTEVCGNTTSVQFLKSWLYNWNKKITRSIESENGFKRGLNGDTDADYDSDKEWMHDDSDIDSDVDNESDFHNVLLVTGPEGCGKSAAIFACAGEQGFTVIEINSSDNRSGALIKHRFGEAMESHGLRKAGQSPQQLSKKGMGTLDYALGSLKQHAGKQKMVAAEKRLVDRSPLKDIDEQPTPIEEDLPLSSQNKRKTAILFEDVDKHFEEDKGFVTALVQLARTTKRPIILTSNRREPGLPQLLEKCRVDFGYPSPQELVLHACLICMAEGVSCSPYFVEHLVDSCRLDLRKTLMALQFWCQGRVVMPQSDALGTPVTFKKSAADSGHGHIIRSTRSGRPNIKSSMPLFDSVCKPDIVACTRKRNCRLWESDARWLFELDVHHLVLPTLMTDSIVCPLSLFVAEKISSAANELKEHAAWVCARKTQERAYALDLIRKASKKQKAEQKRAFSFQPRLLDNNGVATCITSNNEGLELEQKFGASLVDSPVKSLREAKALARSPMKAKESKARRTLLLHDSDDEHEQSVQREQEQIAASDPRSSYASEVNGSDGQLLMGVTQDSSKVGHCDVVSKGLEDANIPHQIIHDEIAIVRRKRLRKKSLASDSSILIDMSSLTNKDTQQECLHRQDVFGGLQRSDCQLTGLEVASGLLREESNECFGQIGRPAVELNALTSADHWTIDNLGSGKQQPISGLRREESNGCLCQTGAPAGELNASPSAENGTVDNIGNGMQQSIEISGCNKINDVDSMPLPGGNVLVDNRSVNVSSLWPTDAGQSSDYQDNRITVSHSLPADRDALEASRAMAGSGPDLFDPVKDTWRSLRDSKETLKSMACQAHASVHVTSSLADLLDAISAADVISGVKTEAYKEASRSFDGAVCQDLEWDSCQEIASQLVCTSLCHSATCLPAVEHFDYVLPTEACILASAKDASAIGKCMVRQKGSYCSSQLCSMIHETYLGVNTSRSNKERQDKVKEVVQTAVFPRGRVSNASLLEYLSYLSCMTQLEEIRQTCGLSEARSRRFQHYLSSKVKSLSASDIMDLLSLSTFRCS